MRSSCRAVIYKLFFLAPSKAFLAMDKSVILRKYILTTVTKRNKIVMQSTARKPGSKAGCSGPWERQTVISSPHVQVTHDNMLPQELDRRTREVTSLPREVISLHMHVLSEHKDEKSARKKLQICVIDT